MYIEWCNRSTVYCQLHWMWNIYCLSFVYNCDNNYIKVGSTLETPSINLFCMYMYRKDVFNQRQHFIHFNLSIALLLGLITFVSGIETASEYRVSDNSIHAYNLKLFCTPRQAVLLWLYCFTISLWQHFAGCSVKECYCFLCCILYFIKDFLKERDSF